MKKRMITALVAALFLPHMAMADSPFTSITKAWTYSHANTGVTSEISAYDSISNTIWVAGVVGVDVLNMSNGSLVQHIDTTSFGSINSIAINNGVAAFAIESSTKTNPGIVQLYNTTTRALTSGTNTITVGALPDMLTFTADGSKLLVANEGTPSTYGARIGSTIPRVFGAAAVDPAGSVSVIDMNTRTVAATAGLNGVAQSGSYIRTNTGMDFEPEYIAVNAAGTKAYVTLQEANAIGVLNLNTNQFDRVIGLGVKDFSLPGNTIDPSNNGTVNFVSANVKGFYMPDGIAAYQANGQDYLVMANEGDFREDDGDRSAASSVGATGDLTNLRVTNTDSSVGNLFAAGARSFSIRDASGNIVFDSGDSLDKKAAELGIYDDARSRDKGVEPEGVELFTINGRTIAAIGLERTLKSAVALYDVTDPTQASIIDMIVTDGDLAPEGIEAFTFNGLTYLSVTNETSNTTSLYNLAAVPEPETYAMLLAGLGLMGVSARRKANK
ncbi:choice-of-anchor I family protein [Methylotenera sp. 1P/1]|uniref:choice-of-anchor I family protein n=1 Tax=Methylotenera sp. 1P/1 TaxID=1131551 RepID=UPI0003A2A958|nr:choice-of-anchor I family protein [Methylotenera sp. 1P/1]